MSSTTKEQEMWTHSGFPEGENLGIEFSFDAWPPSPGPGAVNPFDALDEDGWNIYDKQRGSEWSFFLQNKPPLIHTISVNTNNTDDIRQDVETPRSKDRLKHPAVASQVEPVSMHAFPCQDVTPLAKDQNLTTKIRPPPAPRVPPRSKIRHSNSNDQTPMRLNPFLVPMQVDDEERDVGAAPTSPLAFASSPSNSVKLHRAFLKSVRQLDEFCGTPFHDVKQMGSKDVIVESTKHDSDEPLYQTGCAVDTNLARTLSFGASPQMHQKRVMRYGRRSAVDYGSERKAKIEIIDRVPKKVLVDRNTNEEAVDRDSKTIVDCDIKATVNSNRGHQQSENAGRDRSQVLLNLERKKRIATGDVVADRHQWLMEAFKGKDQDKNRIEPVSVGSFTNLPAKIDKKTTDIFGGQVKMKSAVQRRREEYEQKLEENRAAAIAPKLTAKTEWKSKHDGSYKKNVVLKTIG